MKYVCYLPTSFSQPRKLLFYICAIWKIVCFRRRFGEGPNCFLSDTPSRNFDFNTERDNDSDVWEYRSGSGRCDVDRGGRTIILIKFKEVLIKV